MGQRNVRARQTIPAHVLEAYERKLFELLEGHGDELGKPKRLVFDHEAARSGWTLLKVIEDGMAEGGAFSGMADWCGKLPGAVARIAALMELAGTGPAGRARAAGHHRQSYRPGMAADRPREGCICPAGRG